MEWRGVKILVPICLLLAGCGTMKNGRGWGQDATLLPGFGRIGDAAVNAVTDPYTWAPALGAAVFTIDHFDRRVSRWASEHTPLFGSQANARTSSDTLRDTTQWCTLASALATPSGDTAGPWLWAKAKGIGLEALASEATLSVTGLLKDSTNRTRPDKSNDQSFPSAHASKAFALSSLGRRNLAAIDMNDGLRTGLDVGFTTLGVATAWARVEGKKHYPSDVLAGAALGNLITGFLYDAFMGIEAAQTVSLGVAPDPRGMVFNLNFRY
jgi:membrane-associated phospholipid phosphatase